MRTELRTSRAKCSINSPERRGDASNQRSESVMPRVGCRTCFSRRDVTGLVASIRYK
jgi:hypothetical protein